MKLHYTVAAAAMAVSLLSTAAALAKQPINGQRPYRPATADQEFKTEKLSAPVTLPGVPLYTGRFTFLSGLRYPNDSTGQRIGMTFGCTEAPDAVMDWYRGSLKMYNWTVLPATSDPNLVAAHQGGNTLTIRANRSNSPIYRSEIVISYKCAGPSK
jgi:hypothetical protein